VLFAPLSLFSQVRAGYATRMNKRTQRRLLNSLVSLLIILIGAYLVPRLETAPVTPPVPNGYYRVIGVNDGDTITVNMAGNEEKIRMIGVDTPEIEDPRKPVQCFGQAASAFTKNLLGSQPVRLEADPENTNRDRYNRLLRYVYLPDGRLVNSEIISGGYGFAYTSFPFTKRDAFKQLETEARQAKRGLWNECKPEANQYGGFTANPE